MHPSLVQLKKNRLFSNRLLFFLLPIIYFFFYGRFGLDDIDGGYALSSAYRIINGEVPYRDFILVRPPLFLYLQALPLLFIPAAYQLIMNRFMVYLTFALTAWVASDVIQTHFNLQNYKIDKWLLSCVTFVFSVHNFPPMPWHTTDGILLGVIGIYFLSVNPGTARISLGMLFLVATALVKQSFYPMPFAGLLYLFISQPRRNFTTGLISFLVILLIVYLAATKSLLLEPFLFWTTGSTHLKDALDAGVWSYINIRTFKIPVACLTLFLVLKFSLKSFFKIQVENGWAIAFYSLVVFITIIYRSRLDEPIHFQTRYPQIFLLLTSTGLLIYLFRKKMNLATWTLCFLLILSWCASISWGYRTPLLFSAPLIFGLIWISKEFLHFRQTRLLSYFLLAGGLVSFYFANGNAYYDGKRKDLVYDMGTVFPKLSFIKSDRETFLKYSELKTLAGKYGTNFKTLPGVLLANYLTDTKSPLGVDWALDVEINNHFDVVIDQLNKSNCYVFVEKNPVLKTDLRWSSTITKYVVENWYREEELSYFDVYKKR